MRHAEPPASRSRRRVGMTLLELVVAIAAGGIVLLAARLLYESVSDGASRLARSTREADAASNGETLLRDALAAAEDQRANGKSQQEGLEGSAEEARIPSWCPTPSGWLERCQIVLRLAAGPSGTRDAPGDARTSVHLTLQTSDWAQTATVLSTVSASHLLYLETARRGGVWRERWSADAPLPRAIGLVGERDTLILRVGAP